jgi:hypothetical protein
MDTSILKTDAGDECGGLFLPLPSPEQEVETELRLSGCVFIVLLLLLGPALGSCNTLFGAPSDAHLQSVFVHHQKEFAELVAMCEQDRAVVRIAPGFTWLATDFSWPRNDIGLSPARWDEYRSLFRQLGIRGGVSRRTDYPAAIFFEVYAFGLVTDGSYKGFVYSVQQLYPQVKSLDDEAWRKLDPKKEHVIQFTRIGVNWYLFRERY